MTGPLGTLALPVDSPSWAAAAAGLSLIAASRHPRFRSWAERADERAVVWALAAFAALLSAGYVLHYLRGGPRIIDATSYMLQARALASGELSFDVPDPSGSFRGRFLVQNPDTGALAVIFPPGYAAALALGVALGAPMLVGPLMAGALVLLTHALARRLFSRRDVALLAAALSVCSATLRYHTADTMSHAWSALLFAGAVLGALGGGRGRALASGALLGWLVATRPVTALVAAPVVAALVGSRRVPWLALGAIPGVTLLVAHQQAATGHLLGSAQLAYYAVADGPPGCFRYGFGEGIGCLVEHGDFVRHNLPHGYDAWAATLTTLRRLRMHLLDAANFEPWTLLLPVGVLLGRDHRSVRLLGVPLVGIVLAYAPFYFDGNYPGGGARMFVDVMPFEHVLLAWSLLRMRLGSVAVPLSLVGFAVHAVHEHAELAAREGGSPMFEPRVLAEAGVSRGLLFVETDHGFSLGHRPGEKPDQSVLVARLRRDRHDALLWQWLGRPEAHVYRYDPATPDFVARVEAWSPTPFRRFEAEAEWPPVAVAGGWARTEYAPCASGGRAVHVLPASAATATWVMEVGVERTGTYEVSLDWLSLAEGWEATVRLRGERWETPGTGVGCLPGRPRRIDLEAGMHRVRVDLTGRGGALDAIQLNPVAPSSEEPFPKRR